MHYKLQSKYSFSNAGLAKGGASKYMKIIRASALMFKFMIFA